MTPRLIDRWRRSLFSRSPRLSSVLRVPSRSEVPDPLPRRAVVLIGSPPKWAVLSCPCGAGHTIDLNLGNRGTTRWIVQRDMPPSIHPSIDVQDPVGRCHFWLRDGRVRWVQRPRKSQSLARHLRAQG